MTISKALLLSTSMMQRPAVFVNHGGGPLPLIGRQPQLTQHMKDLSKSLFPPDNLPEAIVIVSAHWESQSPNVVEITSGEHPELIFDYYGFPPETYKYQYPAPGSPTLAKHIQDLLTKSNIPSKLNPKRGWDHGVFVPLLLLHPPADIPVVCVSLLSSYNAAAHVRMGQALAPLTHQNILLLGSGYAFHNMKAFFSPTRQSLQASLDFQAWLKQTLLVDEGQGNWEDRLNQLAKWDDPQNPFGRICHPQEDHLLPLMVMAGAGSGRTELIYDTTATCQADHGTGQADHAVTGYQFF